ncbi:response regulator [Spirosoma flavus]
MTILVVDDELDIKELFLQRFRREIRTQAIQIAFAHSAQEALDYLDRQGSKEILILSDINMPGMSGLELLRRVRSQYPLPPPPVIMMITAYGNSPNYQQAMANGANDFLSKPLDFNLLREKLKPFVDGL